MTTIKKGTKVNMPNHAKGTVWANGVVLDVDDNNMASILYGAIHTSDSRGLRGDGQRIPISELVVVQ